MNKIVKKLVLVAIVSLASTMAWSWSIKQYNESMQGDKFLLNAGVGVGYAKLKIKYDYGYGSYSGYGSIAGLAIPVKPQFLLPKIPLGIYVNVRPLVGHISAYDDWSVFSMAILPGVDWHMDTGVKGLDFYVGAGMGVHITTYHWEYTYWESGYWDGTRYHNGRNVTEDGRVTSARFAFDTHAGVSYYFNDVVGINAEVGWPTWASVSASFKFGGGKSSSSSNDKEAKSDKKEKPAKEDKAAKEKK